MLLPGEASRTIRAGASDSLDYACVGSVPHETLVAVLELLQWRHGIQDEPSLANPLCSILKRLLDIATEGPPMEGAEPDDVLAARRVGQHVAEAAFLAQLVLAGLRALSERSDTRAVVQVGSPPLIFQAFLRPDTGSLSILNQACLLTQSCCPQAEVERSVEPSALLQVL